MEDWKRREKRKVKSLESRTEQKPGYLAKRKVKKKKCKIIIIWINLIKLNKLEKERREENRD